MLLICTKAGAKKGFQLYKLLVKLNLYGSAGIFWQIVYKLWPPRAYMHAKSCWGFFHTPPFISYMCFFLFLLVFGRSLGPWEMVRIWCILVLAQPLSVSCVVVNDYLGSSGRLIALKCHILWPGKWGEHFEIVSKLVCKCFWRLFAPEEMA